MECSPPGSSAIVNPFCNWMNNADCEYTPDMIGQYTARLTVTNSIGMSDQCTTDFEALPPEGLWIEMYWTLSEDDIDLHMLAPGGTPWTNTDCHFGNCIGNWGNLDWGQPGYDGDNPSLDLDDIPGTGPENINMLDPEPAGIYTVFAHDYSGSNDGGDPHAPNDTTINVYLDGNLTWTDTRPVSGEGDEVYFCTVDWGAQTVAPM